MRPAPEALQGEDGTAAWHSRATELDLCGYGVCRAPSHPPPPACPSLGQAQRQAARGTRPPPSSWVSPHTPRLLGLEALSPRDVPLHLLCLFLQVVISFLLSLLFTVTMCPQGRGDLAIPTNPVVYTAKGSLCTDKGGLPEREPASSLPLCHLGAGGPCPRSPLSSASPPSRCSLLLPAHTVSPVSFPSPGATRCPVSSTNL